MLLDRTHHIDPSIFRAYDIRGIVGDTLTDETVFAIGKAFGSLVRESKGNDICIARDGRVSGPALSRALCNGILASGCNVIDVGMVPTPLLYFAAKQLEQSTGVMLTGSHNPANYNGLKMMLNGKPLTEKDIQDLYHRIVQQQFTHGFGALREWHVAVDYITAVKKSVNITRALNIVIDAGNGVTGNIAPALFRALGCNVHELYCEIDGNFPNHHPDPSQPKNLQAMIASVKEQGGDIGLAFDGDGDRLGVVTSQGEIIWPDRLLMLFAKAVIAERAGAQVIYDVKCTNHLEKIIRDAGGEPLMWKTGHSFIKQKIAETNAELAGEMSGHFFFNDRWYGFDDALYAGARLIEILAHDPRNTDAVFADIPNSVNTPELKVEVNEAEKFSLMQLLIDRAQFQDAKDILTIDGLRVNFEEGWGLVRPSNTTPYLVLRFEALNATILADIQTRFRDWMLSVRSDLVLPF